MAATAQEFAELLEPKLSNIWHDAFPAEDSVFPRVMNVRNMPKDTVTDFKMGGFGTLQTQNDGQDVTFDDPTDTQSQEYTYFVRALAYRVHERLWRNDLYGEVERFEDDLMDAARDDAEASAAGLFNDGFGTTNTGFDGLQLFSTAHTRLDGGSTQQNRPSTDESLSLSALHNGLIQFMKWTNDRGRPRVFEARRLVVPPDLSITAYEILDSALKPGTANNDKNVVVNRFNLESPIIWRYLGAAAGGSDTSWFLLGDDHDLNFLWRFRPESDMRTNWDNESVERKVRQGYVVGFGEWRGSYGTDGVA